MIITIDGPSGAGKGTLSARLAEHLDFALLDSGAIYRIVALASLESEVSNIDQLIEQIAALSIIFNYSGDQQQVILNGKDVSRRIREEAVGMQASKLAVEPMVRRALLEKQRNFSRDNAKGLVADGRDMGTVVFPDACVKIFLDAKAEVRAERRLAQLQLDRSELDGILSSIKQRDDQDRNRKDAPLRPATDAHIIDASDLSIDDVFEQAVALISEAQSSS